MSLAEPSQLITVLLHKLTPMRTFASLFVLLLGLAAAAPGFATTVIAPEFPELVNGSDYIVRAKIKRLTYEAKPRAGKELIFTNIEVEVLEVIAGTPPSPLVLTMLGGQLGDLELSVDGAPKFAVGDEDILFVSGNGRNFHPLHAVMHGRYPVRHDKKTGREYMTRNNGVTLADVAEVALPLVEGQTAALQQRLRRVEDALTPDEFTRQIRATRATKGVPRAK
ncbi:MAG: hypothetical protein Q8J74_12340 [Candidatus Didemnitutus sp.]|nr:hypothetical protein [Candidatus Didemnitutus sp.]